MMFVGENIMILLVSYLVAGLILLFSKFVTKGFWEKWGEVLFFIIGMILMMETFYYMSPHWVKDI